ncbi:MAG: alpha/beta hydrolase [Muribaculaceae bacterium]|nr:alpha/beta hydrolase [Muribaculaceae bacterium]
MSGEAEERFATLCGTTLRYTVQGDGHPMIVMHGWGCTAETMASVSRLAVSAGWKVYTVDFPGFGKSTEPTDVWGVEEYTRLIEALAAHEHIENPALAGHSFGGRIGIVYASRNKTDRMILIDAAGVKPSRPISYYLKVYSFKASKLALRLFYGRERSMEMIERRRQRAGSADYLAASPKMRMILSKVVNEDLKHLMPEIKAPTLLIWGTADTATPLSDAKTMEKLIPDAGLVAIEGAGHYSFLDAPGIFGAAFTNFLKAQL